MTGERLKRLKQEYIRAHKIGPCVDCGHEYDFEAMDFDHRPGEPKRFNLTRGYQHSMAAINAELAKCDLVCSNCHRERTRRRRETAIEQGSRQRVPAAR
jgi:hypothetical protein